LLQIAVEEDDTLAPPPLLLVYLLLASNRWQEAFVAFERAAAQYKDLPEIYQLGGFLALEQQQNTSAWVYLEKALSLPPPQDWPRSQVLGFQVSCYAGLAEVAERRRDFKTAIDIFTKWAELTPDDANMLERWGAALYETGQEKAALAKFVAAQKHDATKNLPELSLASLHLSHGKLEGATKLYEQLLQQQPDDARVQFEYGGALLMMGQTPRAKELIDKAANSPEYAKDHAVELDLFAGLIARAQKDYPTAEKHFARVLKLSPGHAQALQQLPLVLVEQDEAKRKQAFDLAALQGRRNPNSPQAVSTLGVIQYRLGQLEDAEQNLRRAVLLSPDGESLYYLARVLVDRNQSADAKPTVEALQAAIKQPGFFLLRDEAKNWAANVALLLE